MDAKYTYKDGTPVPSGYCVKPDHWDTTVQITLRSLTPIDLEIIKRMIQERHEVVSLTTVETVCVVQNAKHSE